MDETFCFMCGGTGEVFENQTTSELIDHYVLIPCPRCLGSGFEPHNLNYQFTNKEQKSKDALEKAIDAIIAPKKDKLYDEYRKASTNRKSPGSK